MPPDDTQSHGRQVLLYHSRARGLLSSQCRRCFAEPCTGSFSSPCSLAIQIISLWYSNIPRARTLLKCSSNWISRVVSVALLVACRVRQKKETKALGRTGFNPEKENDTDEESSSGNLIVGGTLVPIGFQLGAKGYHPPMIGTYPQSLRPSSSFKLLQSLAQ